MFLVEWVMRWGWVVRREVRGGDPSSYPSVVLPLGADKSDLPSPLLVPTVPVRSRGRERERGSFSLSVCLLACYIVVGT